MAPIPLPRLQIVQHKPQSFRKNKPIKDPLAICFTERFLILATPKSRSKIDFWKDIKSGDVLKLSIIVRENGSNRGRTCQDSCLVTKESDYSTYKGYPVNVLRYLKKMDYRQL